MNYMQYFTTEINKLDKNDFAEFVADSGSVDDVMSVMIIRNNDIDNNIGEDIIEQYFTEFNKLFCERAKLFGFSIV